MNRLVPDGSTNGQLAVTYSAAARHLAHGSAISPFLRLCILSLFLCGSLSLLGLLTSLFARFLFLVVERYFLTEGLKPERFAECALMNVRVLCNAFVTLDGSCFDSHEQPYIEVDCQAD